MPSKNAKGIRVGVFSFDDIPKTNMPKQNPLGVRVGVLGGGQLGRMFIQKAIDFNIDVAVMDPDGHAPCSTICAGFQKGDFNNYDDVLRFGANCDVITVEIEHVNVDALEALERMGKKVFPQPRVLRIIQDKGLQKEFYRLNSIPTSEFRLVSNKNEITNFPEMFPVMQKLRTSGYDGRGVMPLNNIDAVSSAFDEPSMIERKVDLEQEISVIVSRNAHGEVSHFPVVGMEFNPEANLVEFLFSPAQVDATIEQEAIRIARQVIEKLEMVGLLAVEMFISRKGELLVNEIAPRPHNSGHQTIEGNTVSQYEQHLRAILGLPPGNTTIVKPAVMVNLLGEKGHTGPAVYEGLEELMRMEGAYLHLYGKKTTKPFRKMGHITVTANTIEEAKAMARKVKDMVRVVSSS
ncbi:MAG: 5-(carboxyamino)imidazole ribonucleotide synthase [Bacteroidota bacterium]